MPNFSGFAEIRTVHDLILKLEHDLKRLEESPQDKYAAFDFFVTAEHILDWIFPSNKKAMCEIRSSSPLLRITSHLANGAKHFQTTDKRHSSVENLEKFRYVEPGYVEEGYIEEPLIVHLSPDEQDLMKQSTIEVPVLARLVLEYWKVKILEIA